MVILFLAACAAMPKEDPKTDTGIAETEHTQDSSYYYFTESQLAKKKGNLDRSIVLLKKAIELDPESVYLKKELTGLFLLQKDEHNALRLVEEILQNHPDDTDALITLGKIKQSQKKLDEAKEAYRRVLVKTPDKQNIHLLLGSIYMQVIWLVLLLIEGCKQVIGYREIPGLLIGKSGHQFKILQRCSGKHLFK